MLDILYSRLAILKLIINIVGEISLIMLVIREMMVLSSNAMMLGQEIASILCLQIQDLMFITLMIVVAIMRAPVAVIGTAMIMRVVILALHAIRWKL